METLLQQKGRYFIVFSFSAVFLLIFPLSTYLGCLFAQEWRGIVWGFILWIISITCLVLGRKITPFLYFSYLLSCVGTGLSVSALYVSASAPPDIFALLSASGMTIFLLFFFTILLEKTARHKKGVRWAVLILLVLLLVVTFFYWVQTDAHFFSFLFFCLIISLGFWVSLAFPDATDTTGLLLNVALAALTAYFIVTLVVIFFLGEGDFLDFDLTGISGGDSKKQRQLKRRP